MPLLLRLLSLFTKLLLSLALVGGLVSCSAFSSDDDDETVLESELDAEDELNGELNDVELTEDEDEDLDLGDDDEDEDDELEDIDEEEAEDLDEEVADNDLDEEDDEDDEDDEDIDEDDFDEEFADADDEDVDDVGEEDEFSDEDLETDEEALAKELGGKDQDYPENAESKPVFPEEVVQKEGAVPSTPPDSGVITSQAMTAPIEPPEPTIPQDDLGMADPIVPADGQSESSGWVPVVKIKEDPFFRNSRLMNAVYIARPGDSIENISEKIYGEDKSRVLLDDNGHLEKGVDPGDKVYYTSPNRPNDKTSLKVFYADKNLQPQTYTTKSGDNMRRLGSKLLGFSEGWKEIWAINPNVDSKTVLKKGTELRYWTGDEQTVEEMMLAKAEAEKPQDVVAEPEPPPTDNQPPPPVVSELPPEPALPEASQAGLPQDPAMAGEPLPEPVEPLPEAEISQVPEEIQPEAGAASVSTDDSLLTMGVVGLLILAGVALVAIQIKNRKAQTAVSPPSLEYTQV